MCRAPAMAAALMTGSSAMDIGNSVMQPALAIAGSAMLGKGSIISAAKTAAGGAQGVGSAVSRTVAAARPSR